MMNRLSGFLRPGGLCKYKNGIFTQISEAPIRTQCITSYDQTHLLVASQDSIRLLNTNTLKQKSICGIEDMFQINTLFMIIKRGCMDRNFH